MLEQQPDLQAAALHAGISTAELRRAMGRPNVRRYSLEQRQLALQTFILGSPAALAKIRDTSPNAMAQVAAIKCGEQLQAGALDVEAAAQRRAPGLSIVLIDRGGGQMVAYQPPTPPPMLDVTPVPEAAPVPSDAEAE
jgi:hypothetical protein